MGLDVDEEEETPAPAAAEAATEPPSAEGASTSAMEEID
jgi:molecular chaperone HtpG